MNRVIAVVLVILAVEGAYLGMQARSIAAGIEDVRSFFGLGSAERKGPNPWRAPLYDSTGTLVAEEDVPDPMPADYVTIKWLACALREVMIGESRRGAALRAQLDQVIELLERRAGEP
jgi:hypothetical protein